MNIHNSSLTEGENDVFQKKEIVRTLFVRGFPWDIKPREIFNLFRPYPGFQNSSLTFSGESAKVPVAFVVFSSHDKAIAAMNHLQGIQFDPDLHNRLRIELAKSNSKNRKRMPILNPRLSIPFTSSENTDGGSDDETVRSVFNYIYTDSEEREEKHSKGKYYSASHKCPTLFIGNIHESNKNLLETLLQSFTGFLKVKIIQKEDTLTCWADFSNITNSTTALQTLKTTNFNSVSGKQIRLEYARKPMSTPKKNRYQEPQL